jgi:long-chain acyl-CoA synthetase
MEITRTFDLLENIRQRYNSKDDVLAGKENGKWIKYNVHEYISQANAFSYGLLSMGLVKGDKVVTITNNRPEWNFIDMGLAQIGVVHVPVYPTISKDDYYYIFTHCQPKMVIVSDKQLFDKIKPIAGMAGISAVYSINLIGGIPNWSEIKDKGLELQNKWTDELVKLKASIQTTDLFTIIYTSGTTGFPKGVMLSHSNIVQNALATSEVHSNDSQSKALSFLPLSHVYERMLNYHYQFKGLGIYYAENMGTIADDLRSVKPQMFCSVPRILELFFEKIQAKGHDLPWFKRLIFFWAINLGMHYEVNKPYRIIYNLKLRIADKLVYTQLRESLGGGLNLIVSGGASLQTRLARFFWATGIKIIEGYGLSETSPVIAVNNERNAKVMIGTVGPILKGLQVKIADDGEILCKGHNVMLGYFKQPELTAETIDSDGWLHTGDIGTFVDGEFLKITDRKKEIFKLSSGKYIAPQVLENKLKEYEFIEQAMVIGENEKFASVLIQPNFSYLSCWCMNHKISVNERSEIINHPKVISRYQKVINELNQHAGQTEQIKRFRLVADEWSANSGELSPTLKLKRKFIYEKYKDTIDQIFNSQKN